MKTILSVLFCVFPLFLFAQSKIFGRVLDKETNEPIPNVVVYTNVGNNITSTDNEGHYNLSLGRSDTVYFRQLAYNFFTISSDTLLLNSDVYLTQNIIRLDEVVISPETAQTILNKSIQHLYAHLQKNKMKFYLYHIEEETDTGGHREAYATIESRLSGINNKNGKLDWNINLVQLDKKGTLEDSFRPKNLRIVQVELLPQKMSIISEINNYMYEFYENNDNQIIIKASPKQLDKKHYRYRLYTINKQDTILTEAISQSFANSPEITTQKFLSLTRQTLSHFTRMKFVKDELSDSYYLKEIQNIGAVKLVINPITCICSFKVNSKEILVNTVNSTKKLQPFDNALFETDFPNTPDFWKKYVNP